MVALYALIAAFALYSYFARKYTNFLFAYLGLMTRLFMLDQIGSSIDGADICFVINLILLPTALKRFKGSDDTPYAKWVKWLTLFYVLELIITLVTKAETLTWSLLVLRMPLIVLSYYIFRTIPWEDWKKFLHYGLYLTLIQGVLYYLQFAGIYLIAGYNEEYATFLKTGGAINIPRLTPFYIFYCLKCKEVKHKYPIILFLVGMVFLTYIRGAIMAVGLGIAYFLYRNRNIKQTVVVVLASIILLPIASNIIERKSGTRSTGGDFQEILKGDWRNIDEHAGTFSFRMAMLVERFEYLEQNPQYMPLGVGTIHEYSPSCWNRFKFRIGTQNEGSYFGWCQIESGDNTWIPTLLRYGLIGVLLHLLLFLYVFKDIQRRKDAMIFLGPVFLYVLATSMDSALFERSSAFYFIIMYFALLSVTYKKDSIEL